MRARASTAPRTECWQCSPQCDCLRVPIPCDQFTTPLGTTRARRWNDEPAPPESRQFNIPMCSHSKATRHGLDLPLTRSGHVRPAKPATRHVQPPAARLSSSERITFRRRARVGSGSTSPPQGTRRRHPHILGRRGCCPGGEGGGGTGILFLSSLAARARRSACRAWKSVLIARSRSPSGRYGSPRLTRESRRLHKGQHIVAGLGHPGLGYPRMLRCSGSLPPVKRPVAGYGIVGRRCLGPNVASSVDAAYTVSRRLTGSVVAVEQQPDRTDVDAGNPPISLGVFVEWSPESRRQIACVRSTAGSPHRLRHGGPDGLCATTTATTTCRPGSLPLVAWSCARRRARRQMAAPSRRWARPPTGCGRR